MKSQTSAVHAATALRPGAVRDAIIDRLERSLGKPLQGATRRHIYDALTLAIREELAERWIATGTRVKRARVKRICYLSMEFLLGRSLINALKKQLVLVREAGSWRIVEEKVAPL